MPSTAELTVICGTVRKRVFRSPLEAVMPMLAGQYPECAVHASYSPFLTLTKHIPKHGFESCLQFELKITFPRTTELGEFYRCGASGVRKDAAFVFDGPWSQFLALDQLTKTFEAFLADQIRSYLAAN